MGLIKPARLTQHMVNWINARHIPCLLLRFIRLDKMTVAVMTKRAKLLRGALEFGASLAGPGDGRVSKDIAEALRMLGCN